MSQVLIRRSTQQVTVALATAASLATSLRVEGFVGGTIDLGTLSTSVTTLQMWAASTPDGEYRRLRRSDGSAADLTLSPSTSAGGFYALPAEVLSVPYLKIVAATDPGAGTVGVVTLKS